MWRAERRAVHNVEAVGDTAALSRTSQDSVDVAIAIDHRRPRADGARLAGAALADEHDADGVDAEVGAVKRNIGANLGNLLIVLDDIGHGELECGQAREALDEHCTSTHRVVATQNIQFKLYTRCRIDHDVDERLGSALLERTVEQWLVVVGGRWPTPYTQSITKSKCCQLHIAQLLARRALGRRE